MTSVGDLIDLLKITIPEIRLDDNIKHIINNISQNDSITVEMAQCSIAAASYIIHKLRKDGIDFTNSDHKYKINVLTVLIAAATYKKISAEEFFDSMKRKFYYTGYSKMMGSVKMLHKICDSPNFEKTCKFRERNSAWENMANIVFDAQKIGYFGPLGSFALGRIIKDHIMCENTKTKELQKSGIDVSEIVNTRFMGFDKLYKLIDNAKYNAKVYATADCYEFLRDTVLAAFVKTTMEAKSHIDAFKSAFAEKCDNTTWFYMKQKLLPRENDNNSTVYPLQVFIETPGHDEFMAVVKAGMSDELYKFNITGDIKNNDKLSEKELNLNILTNSRDEILKSFDSAEDFVIDLLKHCYPQMKNISSDRFPKEIFRTLTDFQDDSEIKLDCFGEIINSFEKLDVDYFP